MEKAKDNNKKKAIQVTQKKLSVLLPGWPENLYKRVPQKLKELA